MENEMSFVISILDEHNERIIKCALKFDGHKPIPHLEATMMDPTNKKWLAKKLPLHVKNIGPIVHVEPIFEIEDTTK